MKAGYWFNRGRADDLANRPTPDWAGVENLAMAKTAYQAGLGSVTLEQQKEYLGLVAEIRESESFLANHPGSAAIERKLNADRARLAAIETPAAAAPPPNIQALLDAAQAARRAFDDAVRALEKALGVDIDGIDDYILEYDLKSLLETAEAARG